MDIREKHIKAAVATALRRLEAGSLEPADFDNIAKMLDAVLTTDAATPGTTDAATPLSVEEAAAELVKRRQS